MKKALLLLVTILVLPLFLQSPSHAALTMFYGYDGSTTSNGGEFYHPTVIPPFPYVGGGSSSYTENFNGYGGAEFSGAVTADTGSNGDSIFASGYTSMTYVGFTDDDDTPGVDVSQRVTAQYIQQFFDPEANGKQMQVSGLMDLGDIAFTLLDQAGILSSSYSVTGSVAVDQYNTSGTSGSNVAYVGLGGLDSDGNVILSGSDNFNMESGSLSWVPSENWGIGYQLTVTLTINASLDNFELDYQTFESDRYPLDDAEFIIGNIDSPVMVTGSLADASAVPVPSSLLLLVSGVAGISFIRRRRS